MVLTEPTGALGLHPPSTGATVPGPIPNDPALNGVSVFQRLHGDLGATADWPSATASL